MEIKGNMIKFNEHNYGESGNRLISYKFIITLIIITMMTVGVNLRADNHTEFGVMNDFMVWGVDGTLEDPVLPYIFQTALSLSCD